MMATFLFLALIMVMLAEFFLASYMFTKGPRSNVHQLAAARYLMLGLFALFSIFFYNATTYENAVLWNKIRAIPLVFLPVLIFLFTWIWTHKRQDRFSRALPLVLVVTALLFQFINFFTSLLGYPIQNPGTAWISIIAGDSVWPLIFCAWAILLVIFTVILSVFYYINIKEAVEKKSHFPVLLAIPAIAVPAFLIGLLPISFRPDLLIYLPFWMLIADILTAFGLTSKKIFVLSFSSTFYPVIQSMNEAVVLVDLLVCAANAAFCRLAEKSESELIGRPLSHFFQTEQFRFDQGRKELLQQGPRWSTAGFNLNGGKTTKISLAAVPVYHDGLQRGSVILIADLSSQKEAEDKINSLKVEISQNYEKKILDLKSTNDQLNDRLQQADQEQQQWRRRVFELESLASLSTELRTARSIQDLLNLLLLKTAQILGAEAGVIFLRNGNGLVVKSVLGVPDDYKGYHYPSNRDYLWIALESGQPVFLNAKEENPATEFPVFLPGMVSAAVCPLKTPERQLGLIVLGFKAMVTFTSKDSKFLESVGKITSNALYRSSAMESLEQRVSNRNRELETLFRIASIAIEAHEPDTILNQTLQILLDTLKAKVGLIFMDKKGNEVFISTQPVEYLAEIEGELRSIPLGTSLWEFIYHSNQPILVQSLEEDSRIDIGIVTELLILGNCSVVSAPIRGSGSVLGALCLFKEAKQPFLPEDLALLNTVTHQLGITVEMIRLRQMEELKTIGEDHHRLARELPESISYLLSTQYLSTEACRESVHSGDQTCALSNLEQISATSLQALKGIRLLDNLISPAPIAKIGLYGAIQYRLETVEQKSFVKTSLSGGYVCKLPGNLEENLFQAVQEALNLILKKSQADEVKVRLDSDYDSILVEIRHNGAEFGPEETPELTSLGESVTAIGGKLVIAPVANHWTTLQIKV